jgi:predicted acyltransferase
VGVFLYAFPFFDVGTMRIMGVLQRIAVAYLLASSICLLFDRRAIEWWIAGILIGYWAAMKFIPVPGIGAGVWTPEGNLSGYIDRIFLSGHMWHLTKTWDPEGLLSTVPSIATVLLGVLAGFELRSPRSLHEKINAFFTWGVAAVIGGLIANPFFPINKNLWTSSYVLVTGGLALIGLACCIYIIEVKEKRTWAKPFVVLGVNAIAAYTFASLLATTIDTIHIGSLSLQEVIYNNLFGLIGDPFVKSASFAVVFVVVTWIFAWFLYKKKWFIKV